MVILAGFGVGMMRFLASAHPIALLDVVVYHCQQSVTYQDVIFQKTHNLGVLLELCCSFEADFDDLRDFADILTPYATEFRYPGDLMNRKGKRLRKP